ncbi:MAG: LpqN/LpqT family lipoprotein [Actinomycetia bacterium]|nr:LpqN/LpqT family lipoprotein [Actinomycetes bacterium]
MSEIARYRRILAGGAAVGAASMLGFAGVTASAQPTNPQPQPAPAIVNQTATAAPSAATPQATGQPAATVAPSAATPQATGSATLPAATAPAATAPAAAAPAATAPAATAPAATAPAVPAPTPVTITPATSGTLTEYFASAGVSLEPQSSQGFRALNIVLPMPQGWEHVPDPNVTDAFAVIADRVGGNGLHTSNAQVVVYKLIGQFDPQEAISHGFVDSQQLPAWRSTKASFAEHNGMPSSLIEGTYRENSLTLNTSRRHVIAPSGPDNYLVSLSVATSVDQVVAAADATEAIVNGFKVSAPSAPAPAVAPGAAPASLPAPVAPAAPPVATPPQPLGLQG